MVYNLFQVVTLLGLDEGEEDFSESRVEDINREFLQVVVEGVGDKEVEDQSRQQGEGGAKGQAKRSREIVWACLEMLELGKGDVVEELDQELTRDVLLIERESFNSDEDGGGGNDEDKKGMDARCGKGADLYG